MGYAILKVFRFLIRLTKRRYRIMSTRETCEAILDTFTDAQLVNVVAMLQAMRRTIDDLEDEAFCEKMAQDYDNDPEKGDPMPLENFAKELGITL